MGRKRSTIYRTLTTPIVVPVGSVVNLPSNSYTTRTVYYLGNLKIDNTPSNGTIFVLNTSDGYFQTDDLAGYRHHCYYVRDHLGNVCAVWDSYASSFTQTTFYYPSGVPMSTSTNQAVQPNKYNGKPYEEMHGFDIYEYEARGYYATIMRFTAMDPLCEQTPWQSPYVYAANNPVCNVDWMGLSPGGFYSGFNTILNWVAMDSEGNYIASGDDADDYHVYLVDGYWDGKYSSLSKFKKIGWEILGQNYIAGKPFYWIASCITSVSSGSSGGWTITAGYALMFGKNAVINSSKIYETLNSTLESLYHYRFGDGSPRQNGLWSQFCFLARISVEILTRLILGQNSFKSITNMEFVPTQFSIGHTTYLYCNTGQSIIIIYGINDGFWDANYIYENLGIALGKVSSLTNSLLSTNYDLCPSSWKPDGKGPNLELHNCTPYDYIPSMIIINY